MFEDDANSGWWFMMTQESQPVNNPKELLTEDNQNILTENGQKLLTED